jgi:SAM-dependent methyltransferase
MKKGEDKNKGKKIEKVNSIWTDKASIKIDLGCGENKMPGAVGVDFRKMNGVDIVQDLTMFPWRNIPNEIADVIMSSHLLEHINPDSPDPRLAGLIDLMLSKKLINQIEVDKYIGDYRFLGGFIRFMDEVWSKLKPGGQFISTFPYAFSPGYAQDPTHVCPISHVTLAYFDPLAKDSAGNMYHLYTIYRPKPWKVLRCFYSQEGFIEVALEKRIIDPSYHVTDSNGMVG